ncbi:hypothetical protein GALMADRAFT_1079765 [Galerina marginata CBS 339.88]|uniref:Uncharacterized protein n=1 Tax=Galerina marginata (strain CBS 339.88) TaxID=685588 RepID=A0A067S9G9_GALM3|nr:hypothetical protein GALMADRAFT_1079765 [Galerina marginata CBS 339.88]
MYLRADEGLNCWMHPFPRCLLTKNIPVCFLSNELYFLLRIWITCRKRKTTPRLLPWIAFPPSVAPPPLPGATLHLMIYPSILEYLCSIFSGSLKSFDTLLSSRSYIRLFN